MEYKPLTLKDFNLEGNKEIRLLSADFQRYVDQQSEFESKSYWIESASAVGTTMSLNGKIMDAYIANDYLGMSQNMQTKEAGIEAILKYGTGACAAQAIGGYLDIHRKLEKDVADFVGQEDAILFSSGFGANAGLLRAILGKDDVAYVDSFIHTSATSGLVGTNVKNIGHNKPEYLDEVLCRPHNYNTRLVIIDGVYSQDGDLSMLPEYIRVCRKHNCMLMMDDRAGA